MACPQGLGEGPAHSCPPRPGGGQGPFSLPWRDKLRQLSPGLLSAGGLGDGA